MPLPDIERRWHDARRSFALGEISGADFLRVLEELHAASFVGGGDGPGSGDGPGGGGEHTDWARMRYLIALSAVPALAENAPADLVALIPTLRSQHASDPVRFPSNPDDRPTVVSYFDTHIARAAATAAMNPAVSLGVLGKLSTVTTAAMSEADAAEARLALAVMTGDETTARLLMEQLPLIPQHERDDEQHYRSFVRAVGMIQVGDIDNAYKVAKNLAGLSSIGEHPTSVLARLLGPLSVRADAEEQAQAIRSILHSAVGAQDQGDSVILTAGVVANAGMTNSALRLVNACAFDVDVYGTESYQALIAHGLSQVFGAAERTGDGARILPRFTLPRWSYMFSGTDGTITDLARKARRYVSSASARFDARNGNDSFSRYIFAPTDVTMLTVDHFPGAKIADDPLPTAQPIATYPAASMVPDHVAAFFFEAMGDDAAVETHMARAAALDPEDNDLAEVYRLRDILITSDDDIALEAAHSMGELHRITHAAARELIQIELLLSAALLDTVELLDVAVRALPTAVGLDKASGIGLAVEVAQRYEELAGHNDEWQVVMDYAAEVVVTDRSAGEDVLIASDLGELTQLAVRGADYSTALLVNRRLLQVYDSDYGGIESPTWRITTLLGRAQLLASIGNLRVALGPAEEAQQLAQRAGDHERHLQAVGVRLELLFEKRNMTAAARLANDYSDLPTGRFPLQEFLVRHGQAMVACTLVEPNFSEEWPGWFTAFTEAGARALQREKDSASLVLRRTATLMSLLASLDHPSEAEDLAAWLVSTSSAIGDDATLNEALLRQAVLFYQHHKHSNAGLILESVIQRAHRSGDKHGLDRALGLLEDWALRSDDPAVSQTYLTIMIGIT